MKYYTSPTYCRCIVVTRLRRPLCIYDTLSGYKALSRTQSFPEIHVLRSYSATRNFGVQTNISTLESRTSPVREQMSISERTRAFRILSCGSLRVSAGKHRVIHTCTYKYIHTCTYINTYIPTHELTHAYKLPIVRRSRSPFDVLLDKCLCSDLCGGRSSRQRTRNMYRYASDFIPYTRHYSIEEYLLQKPYKIKPTNRFRTSYKRFLYINDWVEVGYMNTQAPYLRP